MKKLKFDIMLSGRFYKTLVYEYCPLFPLDVDELDRFVLENYPTLRNKKYVVRFCN